MPFMWVPNFNRKSPTDCDSMIRNSLTYFSRLFYYTVVPSTTENKYVQDNLYDLTCV